MKKAKAIIWDWNGTLLDDVHICIDGINSLLSKRQLPVLHTAMYKDIFTFPVKDYYEKAGFDFNMEPFDIPAMQFIDYYREHINNAHLFPEVLEVLDHFKKEGFQQSILSAMEHDFLHQSIKDKNIYAYFDHITGINNHYAESKTLKARNLLDLMKADPEQTIIVGDTIHDYEVAEEIGCRVILVTQGHQSESRLNQLNCEKVNNLKELTSLLK